MTAPAIGDHVTFYVLPFAGAAMWTCPAIVVDIYPQPSPADLAVAQAAVSAAQAAEAAAFAAMLATPNPTTFAALGTTSAATAAATDALAAVQAAMTAPVVLVLDVTFPDDAFAEQDAAGNGRRTTTTTTHAPTLGTITTLSIVTDGGLVTRQSHAVQATQNPPPSGSWTLAS